MMKQQRVKVNQHKSKRKNIINVELDMKCSCSSSTNYASIQFAPRYLQCQSSMTIRTIRLFIETILPYSRLIKVSIFDSNDRLLKDSDRICSLKRTCSLSNYIPLRFTLINTITSLANCACLSSSIECNSSSYLPTIISQETIDQILSTCSVTQSMSTLPSNLSPLASPDPSQTPIEIVNVLTPPSFQMNSNLDEETMNRITSEFGEICPSSSQIKQYSSTQDYSLDIPLDLSMKNSHYQHKQNGLQRNLIILFLTVCVILYVCSKGKRLFFVKI